MKKRCFLVLMTIFFLGACEEGEERTEALSGKDDLLIGPGPAPSPKTPSPAPPPKPERHPYRVPPGDLSQAREAESPAPCRKPLLVCTKDEHSYQYYVDTSQTVVDDPGIRGRERVRLCQLLEQRGEGAGVLLGYAHWKRGHCVEMRDAKQAERENEGFSCTCS